MFSSDLSPRHIAFIIDGNRRWARSRGISVSAGHEAGYANVLEVDAACRMRGVSWRSYYLLSAANMRRSAMEVEHLLEMLVLFLQHWSQSPGTVVHIVGETDSEKIPPSLRISMRAFRDACGRPVEKNADNVVFFVNYGGEFGPGVAVPGSACLAHVPPVDLVVRTGGERRLSGFIPPQIAFSELAFVDLYWPDFSGRQLESVIGEFAGRNRRFGGDPVEHRTDVRASSGNS